MTTEPNFTPDWRFIEDPIGDGTLAEPYFGIEGGVGAFDEADPQGFRITGWMKREDAQLMAGALTLYQSLREILEMVEGILERRHGPLWQESVQEDSPVKRAQKAIAQVQGQT